MPPRSASSLSRLQSSSRGYICPQCRVTLLRQQQRPISESYKAKVREAEEQWKGYAREIRSNKRQSMLTKLEERGYINEITGDRKKLDKLLTDKRIGVYCGIDPTAPSLHVGHLVPFMALFWMYIHGFHTVSLIGGGTARIGDPTGRTTDRLEMSSTERKANIVSMHYQVKKIWQNLERLAERHGYKGDKYWHRELVNNATWWNNVSFIEVLKYMGRGLRLGPMLGRDTVKRKMDSGDGMSFAEFCYPILQAWDWWRLYDEKKIQMQIGGSDQFGNIVAGLEAVKHVAKTHPDADTRVGDSADGIDAPVGFTVPLLTTASGEKFGKSAGNAIWLDQSMTSLFDLYAFWVGTADADVERYLKLFTFLPIEDIQQLMNSHETDRSARKAQHTLAHEFIQLVHGHEYADKARKQYLERSEQRKTTNLSALMSSAVDTDSTSKHDGQSQTPQQPVEGSAEAATAKDNPLSHNQNPQTREKATYVSRKLNPFAPLDSPNTPAGGATRVTLPASLIRNQPIARVLHSAGLVTSRSEGHRLAQAKGAYIGRRSSNKEQMSDELQFIPAAPADPAETWKNVIRDHEGGAMDKEGEEGLLILRSGKWKVRAIRVVSDEKFDTLGLSDPPGWVEHKSLLVAQSSGQTLYELKRTWDDDPSFIEPERSISRKEANKAREKSRKKATDYFYFQTQAVRQQLLRNRLDNHPSMSGYGSRSHANFDADAAEEDEMSTSSPRSTPIHRGRLAKSPRDAPGMTPRRQARIKETKRRMLQREHHEGSRQALEVFKAEQKSQRDAETERISMMRAAQEYRQRRPAGTLSSPRAQTMPPPSRPATAVEHPPVQTELQKKQDAKSKEMEAAKARRQRERERLVGGMVERGWWKDEDGVPEAFSSSGQ